MTPADEIVANTRNRESSAVRQANPAAANPAVRTLGLVAARSKPEAQSLGAVIQEWAVANGCTVIPEDELRPEILDQVDAIVVLGGDGLMMRAANAYPDIPLLGINFGNVGFLALVEQRDWKPALMALTSGHYLIQEGSTLSAALIRDNERVTVGWAINDVVVRGGTRMVDIELYIAGHYVNTYPGDGMIVSTPHGSSAYCLAAGGPVLTAGVRGFAIVPISCHSPIRTPLVVSETDPIELLLANDREAMLILDGRETATMQKSDVIEIIRGAHQFRLVTFGNTNFYEAFRSKFNFQIRPNAVPSLPVDRGVLQSDGAAPA